MLITLLVFEMHGVNHLNNMWLIDICPLTIIGIYC
jgi:hypothetical protein